MHFDNLDSLKKAMIRVLEKNLGNISEACKATGISRQTHYNWLDSDPIYREGCDNVIAKSIDFAESMLLKRISEGDTTATIFFLKTKGRGRGYIERQQVETRQVTQFSEMSDDELNEFIESNTSGSGE